MITLSDGCLKPLIKALRGVDTVILDTETSSLYPWRDGRILAGIGVKPLGKDAFYFSFRHGKDGKDENNLPLWVLEELRVALEGKTIVFHNAKFDLAVLWQDQAPEFVDFDVLDTVVMMRLVHENEPSYKLKRIAKKYIDEDAMRPEQALKKYMKTHELELYSQVPAEEILPYVEKDLEYTEWILEHTQPLIAQRKLQKLLELEQETGRSLFHIERRGFKIDMPLVVRRQAEVTVEAGVAAKHCYALVKTLLTNRWRRRVTLAKSHEDAMDKAIALFKAEKETFGIQNAAHVKTIFHGLGTVSHTKTKKGGESWDKDALAIVSESHPDEQARELATAIVRTRALLKILTYYDTFIKLADSDNVVHPNIHQAGARTGRMSMSEPNLQQVPKVESLAGLRSVLAVLSEAVEIEVTEDEIFDEEDEEPDINAGEVRNVFIPRPGFFLLMADWSQIEPRILADFAKEPEWIRSFELGLDIYEVAAYAAYGPPPDDPKLRKWWRKLGKQLILGIVYGIGKAKLAKSIQRTPDEAGDFRYAFFNRYPRVKYTVDEVMAKCSMRRAAGDGIFGWIRNLWGRRRYLEQYENYKAPNFLIQGTAADFTKDVTNRLKKKFSSLSCRSGIIDVIHDEYIFEIAYEEASFVIPLIMLEMEESDGRFVVPLKSTLKWSPERWGDSFDLACADCAGSGLMYDHTTEELFNALVKGWTEVLDSVKSSPCEFCDGRGYNLSSIVREAKERGYATEFPTTASS